MADAGKRSLKNYWVRPTMQIRFFLHALGVLTLSMGIGVSYAVMRVASAGVGLDGAEQQSEMLRILVYVMSGGMVVLGLLALVSTAVFVHRVAGPMVPMERMLDAWIAGDFSGRIQLRKADEFQDLVKKLNSLADALESGKGAGRPTSGGRS